LRAKSRIFRSGSTKLKGDDHEEQSDRPLLDLLEGVNENMPGIELKYTLMAHLELTGNSYWLLDGVRDDTTPPTAIYPLNPGRMRVKLDKSSFPTSYRTTNTHLTVRYSRSNRIRSCT
jgi:phage portal protein BeeE